MMHRYTFVFLVLLALAGCGGGDDEPQNPPQDTEPVPPAAYFNLSGNWNITMAECYGDFSDHSLNVLEENLVDSEPSRFRQSGNALEIDSRESGRRVFGTIHGDQLRYADELRIQNYDVILMAEGTAFTRDLVVTTSTYEFRTFMQTSEVYCAIDRERVMEADPDLTGLLAQAATVQADTVSESVLAVAVEAEEDSQ